MPAHLSAPTGDLLRSREYVGLLASRIISLVGDQLARVAMTVLVYQRTGSTFLSAITYAVSFLPAVAAGPLLGGLADRFPRRRVLVLADLLRAGLFALMALPGLPLAALLVLLLVAATIDAPWGAARVPLMRDVLTDDRGFQLGTAVDETLDQTGQVIGFVVGGALLALLRPTTALLLDAASFLLSAVLVQILIADRPAADLAEPAGGADRRLDGSTGGVARRCASAVADARTGLSAALGIGSRRPLLLMWVAAAFTITPEALAAPWGTALGAGPSGIGLLFAAGPAGMVLGLLLVARLPVARAQRLLFPLALLALTPLLVGLLRPSFPSVLVAVVLSGAGMGLSLPARVTFVAAVTGPHRGRAYSVAAAGVTAGQGIAIAGAGALAGVVGPATAVGAAGVVGLLLLAGVARLTSGDPYPVAT